MAHRNGKKRLSAKLKVKRLLPGLTREELEMAREAEIADQIEAKVKRQPQSHCSETFDRRAALENFLAADDPERGALLVSLLAACIPTVRKLDVSSSLMKQFKPKSTLETLLCSQIGAVHFVAMGELMRATESKSPDDLDHHVGRASRLLRTFLLQIEALQSLRSRNGHKQQIVVQHVHVAAEQAVVGVRQGAGA